MSAEYQHLLVETSPAGVQTITLNRPERLNAVNMALAEEIPAAINAASADEAVKVVVVTGAGRGFCAGLDLDPANLQAQMKALNATRQARLDELGWVGRMALAITNCDKPVIAAINGPAAGAGLGLALATDIRLMKQGATVTTGYTRRALAPDAGVSYFLPRLVGLSRATELILSARDISSEEAERIGLTSLTLPADGFEAAVAQYAEQMAGGPPVALTLSKRLCVASLDNDIHTHLRQELSAIKKCFETQDVQEAMRAFIEKRQPNFQGK
jgi:2-(1,2-epoxy-1,2-dihydrophenyl)acetyl-CoA isomerase